MKKLLVFCTVFIIFCSIHSYAQIGGEIGKISNQGSALLSNNATPQANAVLRSLETQLIKKFGLDGAKAEIAGNLLKLKVADIDFTKMSAPARTKEGTEMTKTVRSVFSDNRLDFNKLGLINLQIEMVKNLRAKDVLDTFKYKL